MFLGFSFLGVNYCQKSYTIGAQASLKETPTATPEDGDVVTVTPTGTRRTPTVAPTATVTAEATVTASPGVAALSLKSALKALSVEKADTGGANVGSDGNWLGQIGNENQLLQQQDSDSDGFTDWLEEQQGSDKFDSLSQPNAPQIDPRHSDIDGDGILDWREMELGSFTPEPF